MFRWLPIITSWRQVLVRWLPSITCEENINNHGFSGKHARIPDNDYWWICLFHVVWTKFVFAIILMWYTRNIFLFKFSFFTAEYRRNRQIIIIGVPFRAIVFLHIEMKILARLQLKVISGSMCCLWKFQVLFVLILCLIKKMNGRLLYNYMLGTWEWPQCYFDNNLLPSRISFTLETLAVV